MEERDQINFLPSRFSGNVSQPFAIGRKGMQGDVKLALNHWKHLAFAEEWQGPDLLVRIRLRRHALEKQVLPVGRPRGIRFSRVVYYERRRAPCSVSSVLIDVRGSA